MGTLPTPFREGYTFSGWYAGAELVTAETVNQLTDDLHLTARWTQKTNIRYVIEHWVEYVDSGINPGYKGGTLQSMTHNGVTHQYYRYAAPVFEDGISNGRLELAARTLTALSDGLTMDGITPSGANVYSVIVSPGDSSVFPLSYDRNRYTIRYNANGGSLGSSNVTTTVTYGSQYAVMPSPTRAGYTFVGWFTEARGGVQVRAGEVCKVAADQTLYAHWTPAGATPYTVYHLTQNLKDNTVSTDKTVDNYTVVHTDHLTGTSDTTVVLYAMALDGFIPSGANNYSVTILPDGSSAAYLYYDRRVTDVAFDSTGGSDVGLAMRLYYGGTFAFLPATPARTGYAFTGWYTGPGDTARKVEASTEINAINPDNLAALTLYAHWTPNTYDLIFETHDGALSTPKRVTYDEAVGELPTAILRGYIFQGWYDKDGKLGAPEGNLITEDTIVSTDTIIQVENDEERVKTLYSWYEPVQIDFTLDPMAGELDGDATFTASYDKTLGDPPVPTREGYTFKAWHLGSVDGQAMTADTICKLVEDSTLYAEYTPNLYVVKLDVNGGIALDKPTMVGTFDAPYGQLPAPSRVGHTFLGWFNEVGEQVTADTILTTASGHTLTAHWQANTYTVTLQTGEGEELEGATTRTVTYAQPYGELPAPKRNGYVFSGWYTGEQDGLLIEADTAMTTPADHTLYAHWRVRSSGGGGSGSYAPPTTPKPENKLGSLLEMKEHNIYLVGFPDGTIRPNDTISRAEVAQILYRLLTMDAHMNFDTNINTFEDVSAEAWYNIPVSTLTAMGILKGQGNNYFAPAAPVSRAEFATVMARFHGGKFECADPFADTADCWARDEIGLVASLGWMTGTGNGSFDPTRSMSRAEAVAVINRALGRRPETVHDLLPSMKVFPDNADETAWFYLDIQEAVNGHTYTKNKDGAETWLESK